VGQPNSQVAVSWAVGNHIIKHNQGTEDLEDQIIESCKNGGNQTVEKGAFNVKNLQKLNHGLRKQWSQGAVEGNPSNPWGQHAMKQRHFLSQMDSSSDHCCHEHTVQKRAKSMNTLNYFELPIRVYQVCCIHWPFVVVKYPKSKNVGKIRHLLVFLHSHCWGKSGFTATNAPVSFTICSLSNLQLFFNIWMINPSKGCQPHVSILTPPFVHGHLPIVNKHITNRFKKTHTDRSIAVRRRDPRIRYGSIPINTIFLGGYSHP